MSTQAAPAGAALVLRADHDGVATLTLNRPEKLNALNAALFVELRGHIDALASDERVGCVVVTGAGRSFCAGNDLGAIAAGGAGERLPTTNFQAETIDALESLPMPTIAKVRGHCFTGGLELALGCDLIVAAAGAQFADTHGVWGLAPVWGMSVRLPERVGRAHAKDLMFTGRRIGGAEALAIGLADRSVDDAELDDAVTALAAQIVANSWGTSRIDKALLAGPATNAGRRAHLDWERTRPFGLPHDMAERLSRGRG